MNRFPLEIVHRILEYDGRIKYRNGIIKTIVLLAKSYYNTPFLFIFIL